MWKNYSPKATMRRWLLDDRCSRLDTIPACEFRQTRGLVPRLHDTTDCQTGCITGWMFVYTMQPVVQPAVQLNSRLYNRFDEPVVKPVWQQVVSCKRGLTETDTVTHDRSYANVLHKTRTAKNGSVLCRSHEIYMLQFHKQKSKSIKFSVPLSNTTAI